MAERHNESYVCILPSYVLLILLPNNYFEFVFHTVLSDWRLQTCADDWKTSNIFPTEPKFVKLKIRTFLRMKIIKSLTYNSWCSIFRLEREKLSDPKNTTDQGGPLEVIWENGLVLIVLAILHIRIIIQDSQLKKNTYILLFSLHAGPVWMKHMIRIIVNKAASGAPTTYKYELISLGINNYYSSGSANVWNFKLYFVAWILLCPPLNLICRNPFFRDFLIFFTYFLFL